MNTFKTTLVRSTDTVSSCRKSIYWCDVHIRCDSSLRTTALPSNTGSPITYRKRDPSPGNSATTTAIPGSTSWSVAHGSRKSSDRSATTTAIPGWATWSVTDGRRNPAPGSSASTTAFSGGTASPINHRKPKPLVSISCDSDHHWSRPDPGHKSGRAWSHHNRASRESQYYNYRVLVWPSKWDS